MPPTFRDLAPFLTPYVSPTEWAAASSREGANLVNAQGNILQAQAQKERIRAEAAQAREQRSTLTKYQQSQLQLDKDKATLDRKQKAVGVVGQLYEAGRNGDDAGVAQALAQAQMLGVRPRPVGDHAPVFGAEAPLAPPPAGAMPPSGQLAQPQMTQQPSQSQMPQQPSLVPPLAPPMAAAPPQLPPPTSKYRLEFEDGEEIGVIDLSQLAQQSLQRGQAPIEAGMAQLPDRNRQAAEQAQAFVAPLTLPPDQKVKLFQQIMGDELDRDVRREGHQYMQQKTADAQSARDARARETETTRRNNRDLQLRKYGTQRAGNAAKQHRVPDYLFGADQFGNALKVLDDSTANPAKLTQALFTITTAREPGARTSDKDFEITEGFKSLKAQGEDKLAELLSGDKGAETRKNLRELILQNMELNEDRVVQGYRNMRALRDEQHTDPEWEAMNEQLVSLFGRRDWFGTALADDKEYLRRMQQGRTPAPTAFSEQNAPIPHSSEKGWQPPESTPLQGREAMPVTAETPRELPQTGERKRVFNKNVQERLERIRNR